VPNTSHSPEALARPPNCEGASVKPSSEQVVDLGFIRRTGKAIVVAGFIILGTCGWVAIERKLTIALVGLPLGLFFISYGIDVVSHPLERRVLGPTEMSQWILSLLARFPGTIDSPNERPPPKDHSPP
jgi:hypothetical protein